MWRVLGLLGFLFVITGCSSTSKLSVSELEQSLISADEAFSEYSATHDFATAFNAYLVDNAVLIPVGADPIDGRPNIVQALSGQPPTLVTWEPEGVRVAPSGDMGYTWGKAEVRPDGMPNADPIAIARYLTIWVRDAEGNWKVSMDMGSQ